MSKNANVVPPMTPGEPPKKDNTLKIVIICLVVFVGVPILAIIVIIVLTFSLAGGLINRVINEYGTNASIVDKASGESIEWGYATALGKVYGSIDVGEPAYITRSDCLEVESFIIAETAKNFSICGENGFKGYAYEELAENTYNLGFYGVGNDSDYTAEIKLSESFMRYYNITIRRNTGIHDDEVVEVYYSGAKNLPIDCDSSDGTEDGSSSTDCIEPEPIPQTEEKTNDTEEMQLDRA